MPDHLWVPASVRDFVRGLSDDLRKATNLAIMALQDDPLPPDARVFRAGGEEIKGCYELDIDLVTIFYVVDGEHAMIQVVDWRIL
jgi:hypothetical protein